MTEDGEMWGEIRDALQQLAKQGGRQAMLAPGVVLRKPLAKDRMKISRKER